MVWPPPPSSFFLAMIGFNVQKTQPAPADPEAAPPTYEKVTEDERKKLEDVRWNFVLYIKAEYTVKKVSELPVPSRDVTNQTLPGRE